MRVLLITGSLPPMKCGVGDYSFSLAKALAVEYGIHIGILTSANGCISDDIEVFPVVKNWYLTEAIKFIKIIKHWSPDIVHIQYPTQGYGNGFLPWILPIIAFIMGSKVVQTWHEGYGMRSALKLFLKVIIPSGLVVVREKYKYSLPILLRWALWNKEVTFIRNASPIPKNNLNTHEKHLLKEKYLNGQRRLVVFFGFLYPHKRTELLFKIADPSSDQIVIAGEIFEDNEYCQQIMMIASAEPWTGKATITGFLQPDDVAKLLAVADAVILPFLVGGGEWNTSLHAAVLQGTLVITTSITRHGYDEKYNIYYTKVDDYQEMNSALDIYSGKKRNHDHDIDRDEWKEIAREHILLYERQLIE
jgi:glycosyltransferase involved in cell wall biosynthesis